MYKCENVEVHTSIKPVSDWNKFKITVNRQHEKTDSLTATSTNNNIKSFIIFRKSFIS